MLCCPLLLIFLRETFSKFELKNDSDKSESKPGYNLFEEIRELPIYRNIAADALKTTDDSKDARKDYEDFLGKLSKVLYELPMTAVDSHAKERCWPKRISKAAKNLNKSDKLL